MTQIQMAQEVLRTIEARGVLLAEAGVDTGKMMAYLLPAVESFRSMHRYGTLVISTRTINLQEQLANKDLPVVADYFKQYWGFTLPEVLLSKGKRNYLCRRRLSAFKWKPEEDHLREAVERWAEATSTDDLYEEGAPYLPERIRNAIAVERCDVCDFFEECFYYYLAEARQDWRPKIIVTNHNQFIEHLKLRRRKRTGLWHDEAVVVIDEAHTLETIARQKMAYTLSFREAYQYLSRLQSLQNLVAAAQEPFLSKARARLEYLESTVQSALQTAVIPQEPLQRYPIAFTIDLARTAMVAAIDLKRIVESIDVALTRTGSPRVRGLLERLRQQGEDLIEPLYQLRSMAASSGQPDKVVWVEMNGKVGSDERPSMNLVVAPLDIASFLRERSGIPGATTP